MTASALHDTHIATRQEVLSDFAILETAPEKSFDDLAWLASQVCCTSMALITLVDDRDQRLKSKVGLSAREATGEFPFFRHLLAQRGLFQVKDALQDDRFAEHPQVEGKSGIRFFAGLPLLSSAGSVLGTISVLDRVPRQLSREQTYALEVLARLVVNQLSGHENEAAGVPETDQRDQAAEARLQAATVMQRRTESELELRAENLELKRQISERIRREEEWRSSEWQLRSAWDNSNDGMRLTNPGGVMVMVNEAFCRMVGKTRDELVGKPFSIIHGEGETGPAVRQSRKRADEKGFELRIEKELILWNGRKINVEISNTLLDQPDRSPMLLSIFRDVTELKHSGN